MSRWSMKWTIPELKKLRTTANKFAYTAVFDAFLREDDDILAVSPAEISGSFQVLRDPEQFVFMVEVDVTLVMACAITLRDVEVPLSFETELVFGTDLADDDVLPIDGITIDLDQYLWGEILVEKPMRVVAEDAYDGYSETKATIEADEPETANPFAKLKH
ncbi:MAG: YceD family protein [Bacillus subtilis]|nr:YceD family protein [Bacillus subtilis]